MPSKVIAHRGASGHRLENTLLAYATAHDMAADAIELDLVMTRDGTLIAFHDLTLEDTTNVRELFPDRARPDTHWYALDFDLEEIQRLVLRARGSSGVPCPEEELRIPSFDEVIQLVEKLNRTSGRDVGLYLELKAPGFHRARGVAMEEALLASLERRGCGNGGTRIAALCEEPSSLRHLRFELGARLPLIQLIDAPAESFDAMTTLAGLDEIAAFAHGIAPEKRRIEDASGASVAGNRLVLEAHARGLFVQPFTFLPEESYPGPAHFEEELERFFFRYGVDGVFTDFPDLAASFLAEAGSPLPPAR
jgi:glycerophosphoryl diester phosphodiesterase